MKKYWLGLMAIVMGLFISSCNNNGSKDGDEKEKVDFVEQVTDLVKAFDDIKSADDVINLFKEAAQLNIDFYKSNPSAEEVESFEKAGNDFSKTLSKLQGDKAELFEEAFKQLREDKDFMKLSEEANEAEQEWKDKQRDNEDEDEDEYDE